MKTRFAIVAIATVAAFASIGNAVAGELYADVGQSFSPATLSAPMSVAGYEGGGELYPAIERLANQPVAQTPVAKPTPAIYATGGELFAPSQFGNSFSAIDTNVAE